MSYSDATHIVLDVRNIKTNNHVSNSPILSVSTATFTLDNFEGTEITTDNISIQSLRDIGFSIPSTSNHVERSDPRDIKEVMAELIERFEKTIKEAESEGRQCFVWSSDRGAFVRALFVHSARCGLPFPIKYNHERDAITILNAYDPTPDEHESMLELVELQSKAENRFSRSASAIALLKRSYLIWTALKHITSIK